MEGDGKAQPVGVGLGQRQRPGVGVAGMDPGIGSGRLDRQRDGAGAGSHVKDARPGPPGQLPEGEADQPFGFGPGDENAGGNPERKPAELRRAQDQLKGRPSPASGQRPHPPGQGRERYRLGKSGVEDLGRLAQHPRR